MGEMALAGMPIDTHLRRRSSRGMPLATSRAFRRRHSQPQKRARIFHAAHFRVQDEGVEDDCYFLSPTSAGERHSASRLYARRVSSHRRQRRHARKSTPKRRHFSPRAHRPLQPATTKTIRLASASYGRASLLRRQLLYFGDTRAIRAIFAER